MIALSNGLPVVKFSDGTARHFQRTWLHRSLLQSAKRAGYENWWLAEHVSSSVLNYFAAEYQSVTISSHHLDKMIRSTLESIGFADIATVFESCPPPARLSLTKVARDAGAGYELFFFGLLKTQLQHILRSSAEQIEIYDLKACVKALHGALYWKASCSILRDEIVEFIRTEIQTTSRPTGLNLQLS